MGKGGKRGSWGNSTLVVGGIDAPAATSSTAINERTDDGAAGSRTREARRPMSTIDFA